MFSNTNTPYPITDHVQTSNKIRTTRFPVVQDLYSPSCLHNSNQLTQMPSKHDSSPAPTTSGEAFTAAVDQGTTSSRFLIFDPTGTPRASHQVEFPQIYPHSGWIEHDPYDILNSVLLCVEKATEKFIDLGYKVEDIKALGITNQRETTVGLLCP